LEVRDVVLKIVWVAIAIVCWILYAVKVVPFLKEGASMWALVCAIGSLVLLVIYSVVVVIALIKDYLGRSGR
jgi:uncharacterized membrane protein YwzB